MKAKHFLAAVLFVSALVSCGDGEKNPFLEINPLEAVQVENGGGGALIKITTNVDDWTFGLANAAWLTGEATSEGISLKADANPDNTARRAVVTISSAKYPLVNKTLSVIQTNTFLIVLPDAVLELSGYGDATSIGISTNAEDWTASADSAWLAVATTPAGITLSVDENPGKTPRTAHLTIRSEKYAIERIFSITQGITFVPRLNVSSSDDGQPVAKAGDEVAVTVDTNIPDWEYSVENNPDWLSVSESVDGLTLTIDANPLKERTVTLNFTSATYPEVNSQLQITQTGVIVIFEEDFNFLTGSDDIFTDTNQRRFETWETAYGTTHGWTSTYVRDGGTTPYPWLYSRKGYVKFSKTSYNGDIISPALTAIEGTQDVVVSFKACGYTSAGSVSAAGTLDPIHYIDGSSKGHADVPNELNIEIIGPGTASQTMFDLDNYPDDNRRLHGAGWLWQMDPAATRTFTITGATSETQIRFIAGKKAGISTADGTTNGTYYTYRHGLDDVLVCVLD
ncbi:MAG: hypothetical protein LBL04_08610 [Bacteroidales bacterium]|jgi:hypothetical protein|nr:hypothetical protein [Bacteroidales bacterium]